MFPGRRFPDLFRVSFLRTAAICLCLLFAVTSPAWGQGTGTPTFTNFDIPGAGTTALLGTFGVSMNDSGTIAGIYLTANGASRGFIRAASGSVTLIDAPGAGTSVTQGTFPVSINAAGDITGMYFASNNSYHGFVRPAATGVITQFDVTGAPTTIGHRGTVPLGIDTAGDVAGFYIDSNDVRHGFLRAANGTFTTINVTGAGTVSLLGTVPVSINASGVITGFYLDSTGVFHGFVRATNGTITAPIDAPGAATNRNVVSNIFQLAGTSPTSIDTAGDITGAYSDPSGVLHGFLRAANGTITAPINVTGAGSGMLYAGTANTSINASGEIIGVYPDATGVLHGFTRAANGTIAASVTDPSAGTTGMFPGTIPVSINSSGNITGVYSDANQVFHGFVLTPGTGTTIKSIAPNPAVYGQSVVFTATVASSSGSTPPDGEIVSFLQGTTVLGTGTLASGTATFTTSSLAAATYSVTASYPGDANFAKSTSAASSLVVNEATPILTWSTPSPITLGTALSATQLNATANVPGNLVYAPPVGTMLAAGTQTLSVTFTPTDTTDYKSATTTVSLIVNPGVTFTLGGAVSGLSGTGLVLQNNSGNNLAITANGTFTFTSAIASGSTYNVTVLTQPTGPAQNCVVTNGTGTANANVTNVQVACTTASFAIGGTVSGLSGTGLVLQNNSTNSLPVSANGNFTFTTAITSGSAYNVTVLTQPSNPAQNCVVTNGSGTVNANVTSVQVVCTTITYTIGGTVSGLSGTGLVLQNNGGNNLSVSANGNFTFTTAINAGSTYNVAVFAQPSGPAENCLVTNGSGTATANVTSVQVVCNIITHTIGGTVSGLTGTGLVLQDNGGSNLPIAANGSFTFTTPLIQGSSYNVTVLTQPTGPVENCAVINGSGTALSNVVSVQVSCAVPPVITGLAPATTNTGSTTTTLTVNGNNFVTGASVLWNGSSLATTFVSASQLQASVPGTDLGAAVVVSIAVANPVGAGGTSTAFSFVINTASGGVGAFTVGSTTTTLMVTHGQAMTVPVTLTGLPSGASLTVTCVNLPAGATCSYSNGVVTITTSATTPTGTFPILIVFSATQTTTAMAVGSSLYMASLFGFAGLPLGLLWVGGIRRKTMRAGLLLLFGLLLLLPLASCNTKNSTPATQTQTTSQSSLPITLTVN